MPQWEHTHAKFETDFTDSKINDNTNIPVLEGREYLLTVFRILYHFVVPMGISPMGNSGGFPEGKPAATESRYSTLINYKVHAGSFRGSIIHRTV